MPQTALSMYLPDEESTDALGGELGVLCHAGDCIALSGRIGAGKSALARAFIRARLGQETEVPSPTFTLVQTYEADRVEIWHADLYRLGDPSEVVELGLLDAIDDQICIIEWPEIIEDLLPNTALRITLMPEGGGRRASFEGGAIWRDRLAGLILNA